MRQQPRSRGARTVDKSYENEASGYPGKRGGTPICVPQRSLGHIPSSAARAHSPDCTHAEGLRTRSHLSAARSSKRQFGSAGSRPAGFARQPSWRAISRRPWRPSTPATVQPIRSRGSTAFPRALSLAARSCSLANTRLGTSCGAVRRRTTSLARRSKALHAD
jgi:hypothetical protein